MTTEDALPGRLQARDASNGDQPPDRPGGTGSAQQRGTGSWGLANNLYKGALVFGGISTILIALRLLSAAKANPETAYGILQASGTANVIIGTVLSLIPSIALIGASCLVLDRIFSKFSKSPELDQAAELGIWTSICALFLIALFTIPFRYWEVPAAVVVALILARIFRQRIEDARKKKTGRHVAKAVAGLIAGLFLLGVILSPPWMPAEKLTFTNAKPVTGYVLDQSQSGLTVLAVDSRQILYYGPKDLATEAACSDIPSDDLPIVYYTPLYRIFHLFRYKHC